MFAQFKLYIYAAVLVVFVGLGWYAHHEHAQNEGLQYQIQLLNSHIKDQNDAVTALKKDGDARLAAAQNDLRAAQAKAQAVQQKATVIYKTLPSTPGDTCKSSLDLLNEAAK